VAEGQEPHCNFWSRAVPNQHPNRTMLRSHIRQMTLSLAGISCAALIATMVPTGLFSQDLPFIDVEDEAEIVETPKRVPVTGWEIEPKWEPLIGNWALMSFVHPDELMNSESIRGYITVTEGFLSMIIHARPMEGVNETAFPDHLAQAGLHRWRITDRSVLQLANVMGHSNFGEELQWEQPNEPREFAVLLEGDDLILRRPDNALLTFRRVTKADFPKAAIIRMLELGSGSE
jgi:hypothetical protein